MIFWSIAIVMTAIACAALFYAARRGVVNETSSAPAEVNDHFRQLLAGIDADSANGKLDAAQADAARGELAREMLRAKKDVRAANATGLGNGAVFVGLGAVVLTSFGLYAVLGSPEMPAVPLADRPEIAMQNISLDDAIAQIEARLAVAPDDVRGWGVIAPAYIETGRYSDAVAAYRQVLALSEPNAERQTNLAEALLLEAGGNGSAEALELLRAAAESDPANVKSRLYLAAEAMRTGGYVVAADYWRQAIALATGNETWFLAAQQGLAVAEAGGVDSAAQQQTEMIEAMVASLSQRLASEGGSVEDWMQLVRSYVVLGDRENAQAAYDAAVSAYPAAFDRGELDTLALGAGLTLNGGAQ